MRSDEERVEAVRKRIAELEKRKKVKRMRIAAVSSIAASLLIIFGISAFMPLFMETMPVGRYGKFEMTASIFNGSMAIGYIVVAVVAFILGVSVTILCFRLHAMSRDLEKEMAEKEKTEKKTEKKKTEKEMTEKEKTEKEGMAETIGQGKKNG